MADPNTAHWLEALRQASLDWRAPAEVPDSDSIRARVAALPPDVRVLYEKCNGVRLPGRVTLFPLFGGAREMSTFGQSGDRDGLWHFGRAGERGQLFAAKKRKLPGDSRTPYPDWLVRADGQTWIYGIRNDAHVKLFDSLPALLTRLLPNWLTESAPAEEPEFAKSSDVELLESDSLELDIVVDETPDSTTEKVAAAKPKRAAAKKKRAPRKPAEKGRRRR